MRRKVGMELKMAQPVKKKARLDNCMLLHLRFI